MLPLAKGNLDSGDAGLPFKRGIYTLRHAIYLHEFELGMFFYFTFPSNEGGLSYRRSIRAMREMVTIISSVKTVEVNRIYCDNGMIHRWTRTLKTTKKYCETNAPCAEGGLTKSAPTKRGKTTSEFSA